MKYEISVVQSRYYKALLKIINSWLNLTDFEVEIIAAMLTNNILIIDKISRLKLRLILDKSEYTFNNYISRLKRRKILISTDNGLELNSRILESVSEPEITIKFNVS